MLSGRSPAVGRRLRLVEEDRSNLIASPTESEAGSLELYAENGNNDGIEFVPKTTRIGAINQVRKKSKIKVKISNTLGYGELNGRSSAGTTERMPLFMDNENGCLLSRLVKGMLLFTDNERNVVVREYRKNETKKA
jgi:hypothetical protein